MHPGQEFGMIRTASYARRLPGAVTTRRSQSRLAKILLARFARAACALLLMLSLASPESLGGENAAPPAGRKVEQEDSQDVVRAYSQLQEALRAAQLAAEQSRREATAAVAQTAEALSNGLQVIQERLAAQRARELEALQRSNKVMLTVAGMLGAVSFLTMLMLTCVQRRMSRDLDRISATLPAAGQLRPGSDMAALGPVKTSSLRLPGAKEQREARRSASDPSSQLAVKPRKLSGRSLESRWSPNTADSFRRRQFRAFKSALIVGLLFAAVVALLLYLLYSRWSP